MSVQGVGGYDFITKSGVVKDGKLIRYTEIVAAKLGEDYFSSIDTNIDIGEIISAGAGVEIFETVVYYGLKIGETEEEKRYIIGNIDVETMVVNCYEVQIASKIESSETYIEIAGVGLEYGYFALTAYDGFTRSAVSYYVVDSKNNSLIENVEDLSGYENTERKYVALTSDGKEYELEKIDDKKYGNVLVCGEDRIALTYDYILSKNAKMQEIDAIVGEYKHTIEHRVFIVDNKVFVAIESIYRPLIGELYPVIFEYFIESDTFEYIGCIEARGVSWVLSAK